MKKLLLAVLLVLALAIPAFAEHSPSDELVLIPAEAPAPEMATESVDVTASFAGKTKIYGMNSYGYYAGNWYSYEYTSYNYSSCTDFYSFFGIGKTGYYTLKFQLLEKNASGAWVPADEGWPSFTDPMKWVMKKIYIYAGYYYLYQHVHFETPGQKQFKFQILKPDGTVLAQNTTYFDVY